MSNINHLDKDKIIKEKYSNIYKSLPKELQEMCQKWAKLENWDETTWIETLEALIGMFSDYRDAARWIRDEILPSIRERIET